MNEHNEHIEYLHVTAHYWAKGENLYNLSALRDTYLRRKKNIFWSAGDVVFDTPEKWIDFHEELNSAHPFVNLYRFDCRAIAPHPMSGQSLLQIEIEHRWTSDSVAHDLNIFRAAVQRQKPDKFFIPVTFTLIYQCSEHVLRTNDGKHVEIEYQCLGELDYTRLQEILIKPEVA